MSVLGWPGIVDGTREELFDAAKPYGVLRPCVLPGALSRGFQDTNLPAVAVAGCLVLGLPLLPLIPLLTLLPLSLLLSLLPLLPLLSLHLSPLHVCEFSLHSPPDFFLRCSARIGLGVGTAVGLFGLRIIGGLAWSL